MSVKQLLTFGKLWLLLLLMSNSVVAKTVMPNQICQDAKAVALYKADGVVHKDGLQPKTLSFRIISEHHAKPIGFGYAPVSYAAAVCIVLCHVGPTQVLLQDVNRCESVSRFLFPYHFFW